MFQKCPICNGTGAAQNILKEGRRSLGDTKTNVETKVTSSMKR